MLTYLPTNGKRLKVKVTLSAPAPIAIAIRAYDPSRPDTYYLRRAMRLEPEAGSKRAERAITLPMPISPKLLALEVVEKRSQREGNASGKGFTVEGVKVKAMSPAQVWATPDMHSFMGFAVNFAQKAGYARPGFYNSKDYGFLIQYLPIIQGPLGNELVTPARVSRHMPRIQISQRLFKDFTVPVRVAILMHEACHYLKDTRSEKKADLCGIKAYLDLGFPSIEAVYAATKVFSMSPGTVGRPHIDRTKDIIKFIDNYKDTKGKGVAV